MSEDAAITVERLQSDLLRAIKASGEMSYARRAPKAKSLPLFERLISSATSFTNSNPENPIGWEILSRAHECLLDYSSAIHCLKKAASLREGKPTNKTLKRLARLEEYRKEWKGLGLTPQQLKALGRYLKRVEAADGVHLPGNNLSATISWLNQQLPDKRATILAKIRKAGYHSDFSVLYNLVNG